MKNQDVRIKIGAKIRLLRRQNDVTQDMLADHLDVTPQAVSRWESGVCYPDMNSLPLIADYFSVTMDELLCYTNARKEQKVDAYLEEAERLLDRERLAEAMEVLRTALAEIPSSYRLQIEMAEVLSLYAEALMEKGDNPQIREAVNAALDEAVSFCRHILSDCTNDELRDRTKKTLCDIYAHQMDNNAEALRIADQLHSMSYSQEIVKATILTGEVAFTQAQKNLILFADNIWWHLYNLACVPAISGNTYSREEKIAILEKSVALFELIFEDTPYFYADRLANAYRQLAMLHLASGKVDDREKSIACIEKMADAAIACDQRPDKAAYTSVIIEHLDYDKSEDTEARGISKCARLLGGFNSPVWAPLRSHERFRTAITKMIECAKAHPDEE
ncbi:MAG: helix-turn-helix domain-containing protein [Clostridia bacterium]|nr:helix-turn-helix domain-containing protein [Clostridia bacterium]